MKFYIETEKIGKKTEIHENIDGLCIISKMMQTKTRLIF